MKKILFGILVFIMAALYKTPISFVSPYINLNPLDFQGVQGSLWKGNASKLTFDGLNLGEINWTINPLGLLTASVKGTFIIKGDGLSANGNYSSSITGTTLTLDNTEFQVSGRFINKTQKYAHLNGNFRGFIDHLKVQQPATSAPPIIAAMLNWEKGGLSSPIKLPAGNYQLRLKPEPEGKLLVIISSKDAPVDIKGNISINNNWQYQTDLKIKTMPNGKSIQGMLSMAGKPQKDGYIHIKQSGQLLK